MPITYRSCRQMEAIILVLLTCFLVGTEGVGPFSPIVDVKFCGPERIVVNVTTDESGGIIYLRGASINYVDCTRSLTSSSQDYEFTFSSCGVPWLGEFKLVIQRYTVYQTGDDLVMPITCRYNLSDVIVSNDYNIVDDPIDDARDAILSPPVTMVLGDEEGVLQTNEVMLGYQIYMQIYLDPRHRTDFDVKTANCTASSQSIISDYCPVNDQIFPGFSSPTQGMLLSPYFGAFRTTEMSGGSVLMTFTCTVSICKGRCTPATAACNGADGYGRRRRDIHYQPIVERVIRDVDFLQAGDVDEIIEAVQVQTTLRVVDPPKLQRGIGQTTDVCMPDVQFIGIIATLGTLLIAFLVGCILCCCLLMRRRSRTRGKNQTDESINAHSYANPNYKGDIIRTKSNDTDT